MKTFLISILSLATLAIQASDRPNIVFIMADDLGLGDVSHHVRTQMKKTPIVETPAIDRLAQQSLWFTDGHSATALCAPTRYCVMSGNHNYRSYASWGVWSMFGKSAFKEDEVTLGTVVRDAGYSTGFIGKWHLGGDFRDPQSGGIYRGPKNGDLRGKVDVTQFLGSGPKDCGFDYDFTLPCGIQGPNYMVYENEKWFKLSKNSKIIFMNEDTAIHPKDVSDKGPGLGDSAWEAHKIGKMISQKAVDFIHKNSGEKPFFLYYCSPTVHIPHCPPDEFDGKKIKNATPSSHLDMVLDLDQQINRIVTALKDTGEFENTLIVFTSDNGGLVNNKNTLASGHQPSGGWAGSKNLPLEGGHRVPLFAVWPGMIKPGVSGESVINQDMLATFAALVGTKIPNGQALDSHNLLPLFTGSDNYQPREFMMQQAGSQKAVLYRKWPWKLIIQSNLKMDKFEPTSLFNLQDNPTEKKEKNLVSNPEYKTIVDRMLQEYQQVLNSRKPTVPTRT